MGIEIRLFFGILENSELRMHLNGSSLWQQEKTLGSELIETDRNDKRYIGLFASYPLSYSRLRETECFVKNRLQVYCPKLNLDTRRCVLFSQLFIT